MDYKLSTYILAAIFVDLQRNTGDPRQNIQITYLSLDTT